MSHSCDSLIDRVEKLEEQYQQATFSLQQTESERTEALEKQLNIKKALAIIQQVATSRQEQTKTKIENIVNIALRAVFSNPPVFAMSIVSKRNKTECELSLLEGDYSAKPEDAAGGGILDVVSFALRVVLWTYTTTARTLILDEPFKFLSADRAEAASSMLYEISKKLNLQIIMVSHQEGINTAADLTYLVTKPKTYSLVNVV